MQPTVKRYTKSCRAGKKGETIVGTQRKKKETTCRRRALDLIYNENRKVHYSRQYGDRTETTEQENVPLVFHSRMPRNLKATNDFTVLALLWISAL